MLGNTDFSEATISRYLTRYRTKHPAKKKQQSWMTFLKNHGDVIFTMDFFVVPTNNFHREPQKKTSKSAKVISISKIGGIQHRYEWKEAA